MNDKPSCRDNINKNNNNEDNDSKAVRIIPPDINNPPSYLPLKSINERYHLIEKLGTGSFGSVILAKATFDLSTINNNHQNNFKHTLLFNHQNNFNCNIESYITKVQNLVAIKTMMTKLDTLHDYTRVREIKFILSIPANKHIIQIFEIFIDNINFQLHIVMESMEQNLYQLMKNRRRCYFSIPTLKSILAQILEGIKHIHSYNFFHRDIKPENILVSTSTSYFDKKWLAKGYYEHNYVVKLADFGLARNIENKSPYTEYVSTRWYRSPEILLRNGFYSKPIDIWAFGCVAVEVANFKPLFPGSNEVDQIWKILQVLGTPIETNLNHEHFIEPPGGRWPHIEILTKNLELELPYIEGISIKPFLSSTQLSDLIDVVKNCLKWDPCKRMTADQLSKMPFFKDTILQNGEEENSNYQYSKQFTNKDQAMMFAGIKNDNNIPQELFFQSKIKQVPVPDLIHDIDDGYNQNNNNNNNNNQRPNYAEPFMQFGRDSTLSLSEGDDAFIEQFNDNTRIKEKDISESTDDDDEDDDIYDSSDEDDDISNEVTHLLSSCQVPNDLPMQNNFLSENDASNIKQLANDIEIINKDNSEYFNDYAMETPLLKSNLETHVIQNINNGGDGSLEYNINDLIENSTRKLKNTNYIIYSDQGKESPNFDLITSFGGASHSFSLQEVTPKTFITNGFSIGNDDSTHNEGTCSKLDYKTGQGSNAFFGNITF